MTEPTCYRCGDRLSDTHWIRLTTDHRGTVAKNYLDVERCICPTAWLGSACWRSIRSGTTASRILSRS